tara:strand:- start:1824 stop:2555 length:732 start_codon:yes stop_codon:yes gene_type:complete
MPDFKYNFLNLEGEELKIGIYSPAFEGCNPDYANYQQQVFDKFNVKINQCIHTKRSPRSGTVRHGDFLDEISKSEDVDYIVFFDIDAIPLKEDFLKILIKKAHGKQCILGIEQKSNRINFENAERYAGPACFVISKNVYNLLGEPSYNETDRSDCGEELSWIAREKGIEVNYIEFTNCAIPMWKLKDNVKFGIGSEYEGLIFHNFQARMSDIDLIVNNPRVDYFKKKCMEVLRPLIVNVERFN